MRKTKPPFIKLFRHHDLGVFEEDSDIMHLENVEIRLVINSLSRFGRTWTEYSL